MSTCKQCEALTEFDGQPCLACQLKEAARELGSHYPARRPSSDGALWEIASDRSVDFMARQGAYILLAERGYQMPKFLPVLGDPMPPGRPMPPRRLRVIDGDRP